MHVRHGCLEPSQAAPVIRHQIRRTKPALYRHATGSRTATAAPIVPEIETWRVRLKPKTGSTRVKSAPRAAADPDTGKRRLGHSVTIPRA